MITKHPFHLQMLEKEAKVRGIYISVSCHVETVMLALIAVCEEPVVSKRKKLILSIPYPMGNKFDRCKKAVKTYNPNYYEVFNAQFKAIEYLIKSRNMLCHGQSNFDANRKDKSFIDFTWINEGKERVDRIVVGEYINMLKPYFFDHVYKLYTLHAKISEERGE